MWGRTWQMACREEQIPEVGDSLVYEIADWSLVVVRTAPDEIRAFHNSCLHRGTQLRTRRAASPRASAAPTTASPGTSTARCARSRPAWDFPHVDEAEFCLPEAQVGTWGGFVFVNVDLDAASARRLPRGPARGTSPTWPLEDRYLTAHIVRVMPCNWKVALEAFIEAYHTWPCTRSCFRRPPTR